MERVVPSVVLKATSGCTSTLRFSELFAGYQRGYTLLFHTVIPYRRLSENCLGLSILYLT
jgi:hypothetical protein